MADRTYVLNEIVGTSTESVNDAIKNGIRRASRTLRNVDWFEVIEVRGAVADGEVGHYQVTMKVGFRLEDPEQTSEPGLEDPRRARGGRAAVRQHLIERPIWPVAGAGRLARDIGPAYAANGLIGLIFAATGPVAVILAVGAQGGLRRSSWRRGSSASSSSTGCSPSSPAGSTGSRWPSSGRSPARCWSVPRSAT